MTVSSTLAEWAFSIDIEQVPSAVRHTNALQILDITGLILAASDHPTAVRTLHAMQAEGQGTVTVFGYVGKTSVSGAAMINGAMAHVMEFDDSHPVSGSHTSTPVLAAILSLGIHRKVTGKQFAEAMLVGNEITCRLGMVAPGAAHRNGLHPTGIYGTLGAVFAVARLLGLSPSQTVSALAIAASDCPASIMASWEDGTSVKTLHPGFSARAAITGCLLAAQGIEGSPVALEGRFGFFRSVLATERPNYDYDKAVSQLGSRWEISNISSKMYPCGGYFQAHLDAAFDLLARYRFSADDIVSIDCAVGSHHVPLICEPIEEKRRPATTWHARFSMQYTLAEAFVMGALNHDSYSEKSLSDPRILSLTDRVTYFIDEDASDYERLLGEVRVSLKDGRVLTSRNDMRGTQRNPARDDDYLGKFRSNVGRRMSPLKVNALAIRILALDSNPDVSKVFTLK